MCIDMGQADSTLRVRPYSNGHKMAWTVALRKAAYQMGFESYAVVPDSLTETLKATAHAIRGTVAEE